jgi:hypothetical protein
MGMLLVRENERYVGVAECDGGGLTLGLTARKT